MKVYSSPCKTREAWYDPHLRMWTMRTLDAQQDQVDEAEYTTNGDFAKTWVQTGLGIREQIKKAILCVG